MIRRIRVNASLYQLALIISAANSESADFGHARLVAFENPPQRQPHIRQARGLTLTQTPGRLGASPEPEPSGPTREAGDCPPFPRLAGTYLEDSE